MITFTNILCPTDLSDASLPPLTYAAALARWYDARLTVLHVVPPPVPIGGTGVFSTPVDVVPPPPQELLEEALQRVATRAGAGTSETAPHIAHRVIEGEPAVAIVDEAVSSSTDLIVLGTHGRGGFERFMIGSIAEKVLRKAPCPVLTVPPHMPGESADDVRLSHVVCAVDFSPASLQALGFALALAQQAGATVTALHAIEWLVEDEPRTHERFNVPEYRGYRIEEAREQLQALVDGTPHGSTPVAAVVTVGRAHREILQTATDTHADLVVMGTQGRGGLGLALFGSTTQQVVRTATCPVLTVRAPESVNR